MDTESAQSKLHQLLKASGLMPLIMLIRPTTTNEPTWFKSNTLKITDAVRITSRGCTMLLPRNEHQTIEPETGEILSQHLI